MADLVYILIVIACFVAVSPTRASRRASEGTPWTSSSIVLLVVAAALLGYLLYALLRPEKF